MSEPLQIVPRPARLPPQSLEAEQSLLGSLLLDNHKWDDVSAMVADRDFYHQNHQVIFKAMSDLSNADSPIDVVTVADKLASEDNLQKVGDLAYLASLAENTPGVANLMAYARIIRDNSILRSLIVSSNQISEQAYHPEGQTTRQVLDHAEKLIFEISEIHDSRHREFSPIDDLIPEALDRIEELYRSGTGITGVPTGYTRIDELTSGFQRGDLIIVAGRPSMGKTSFAMNIAEYVAIKQKLPVGVFSLEMSGQQLTMRLLSSLSGINSNNIRTGKLNDNDWPRLNKAVEMLQDAPIVVDESSGLNANELRSKSRKMKAVSRDKFGLIIVDYLQLMEGTDQTENRATEISGITRNIKLLAKELDVPIVVLSQLNRSIETRTEKRPRLSDLRESGAIEQDADLILFIHREEVSDPDTTEKGIAEIIIGKQRNGPIDAVRLTFRSENTRFDNYVPDGAF